MKEERVSEFFQQMDTWRFIALVLIGVCVGIYFTADQVIDDMVDNVNQCNYDKWLLENPQAQRKAIDPIIAEQLLNLTVKT